MPDDIFDGIKFRLSGADPDSQWPRLSCSQANQMALEHSDLRLDTTREILFQGNGRIRSPGDILFLTGGTAPEKLRISAAGNVGIGITPLTAKLEVAGIVKATSFQGDGSTLDGVVKTAGDIITGALTINNALTVNGNVGIGTTPLTAKLEVAGIVKATSFQGDGSTLDGVVKKTGDTMTGPLAVQSNLSVSGNVGIGTTNPSRAKLEISGMVGNTVGLFGQGAQGMSLVASWPSLGFNSYFNNGWTSIDAGWSGVIDVDQGDGAIQFYTTSQSSSGADTSLSTLTKQVRISSSGQLNVLNNGLKINGDFELPNTGGGFATFTHRKYYNEANFQNNNVKLIMGTQMNLMGDVSPPPIYEFAIGDTLRRISSSFSLSTRFNKRFWVNTDGDLHISGGKNGFVTDYFVNRLGDTLEQGDVVVISQYQVSHYSGTRNNIPIPEVDLPEKAYDSRVCGIVQKFVTEQDLPYVEIEHEVQAPPEGFTPEMLEEAAKNSEPYLHPMRQFAAEFQEDMDRTKVQDGQMGLMVTLGAFAHCKIDADIAPIEVGDLLTTSPTKGHAQKVLEPERAIGAIIGKALASLEKGKGKIPVLVMLQ